MPIPSPPSSDSTSLSSSPSSGFEDENDSFLSQLTSSDPLSYLLQMDTADNNSFLGHTSSAQDWSPFASWLENVSMPQDKGPDMSNPSAFDFSMPMNLDFDSSMAIEPSSLHFNTSIFTQHQPDSTPMFDATGTFKPEMFTQLPEQIVTPSSHRRLSVTSSSSSSRASLSPMLGHRSTPGTSVSGDTSSNEDAGAELAQRVLQAAGAAFPVQIDIKSELNTSQPKLPIPRLPRPAHMVSIQTKSPLVATPAMQTIPGSTVPVTSASTATSVLGRLKTSHTTIERRYRTNLNARITGLKQSVPALRVLEARLNGKDSTETDVVDERGFVDGVKVGRKMSKANVLGKATEYIKVLKRRETRLKREQAGLKSLVGGLVNGAALLQAWESQWRETFGGEEKDEIEEETGSDEEGDGDDDDDEDANRAKKKARTVKALKEKPVKQPIVIPTTIRPSSSTPSILPEKRKRGRPRKVPVPVSSSVMVTSPPLATSMDHELPVSGGQASNHQYLLAVFAFMSFFNSSLKTSFPPSAQPHTHTGLVLNHPASTDLVVGYGWRDLIQIFHLFVSALVFLSIVAPWLPNNLKRTKLMSSILWPLNLPFPLNMLFTTPSPPSSGSDRVQSASTTVQGPSHRNTGNNHTVLLEALSVVGQTSATEAKALRKALGISSGIVGLCQGIYKAGRKDHGIELNQLEQRAWIRLGELIALDDFVSVATRLQTYWGMSWHISPFSASTTDLTTLALIIRPISSSKASGLWERAGNRENLRPYEKLVLNTLDVNEAAGRLAMWRKFHLDGTLNTESPPLSENCNPLRILAEMVIRQRIKKHASVLFIKSVDKELHRGGDVSESEDSDDESCLLDAEMDGEDEAQRSQTFSAGRSLGGTIADLAVAFEKVCGTGACELHDLPSSPFTRDEVDIKDLLSAVVLYRKIFGTPLVYTLEGMDEEDSSSIRPPSQVHEDRELHLSLRKVLGSTAFEMTESNENESQLGMVLEDARDMVVDMLVDSRTSRNV